MNNKEVKLKQTAEKLEKLLLVFFSNDVYKELENVIPAKALKLGQFELLKLTNPQIEEILKNFGNTIREYKNELVIPMRPSRKLLKQYQFLVASIITGNEIIPFTIVVNEDGLTKDIVQNIELFKTKKLLKRLLQNLPKGGGVAFDIEPQRLLPPPRKENNNEETNSNREFEEKIKQLGKELKEILEKEDVKLVITGIHIFFPENGEELKKTLKVIDIIDNEGKELSQMELVEKINSSFTPDEKRIKTMSLSINNYIIDILPREENNEEQEINEEFIFTLAEKMSRINKLTVQILTEIVLPRIREELDRLTRNNKATDTNKREIEGKVRKTIREYLELRNEIDNLKKLKELIELEDMLSC